eukprot:s617_g38.t1
MSTARNPQNNIFGPGALAILCNLCTMAKGKIAPLVTRDLTPTWRRKKAERKRLAGQGYPGSQPLLQEEETTSRVDKSSLPPEWVDHAERADEEIKEIKRQIDHLAKAQQRRLELPENHSDSRARERDVEAVSSHVSTLIRCCEQTIHQIRSVGKKEGLLDDEFRQNMQRNLASQLQQVSKLCREQQKTYMAELKQRKGSMRLLAPSRPGQRFAKDVSLPRSDCAALAHAMANSTEACEVKICEVGGEGLFLPLFGDAEQVWPAGLRGFLYLLGLLWTFIGVAIVADVFMSAIETITSKKKRVVDPKTGRNYTTKVWNETVSNLTLMALGSSAPEILLSIIELVGDSFFSGALGPSTIVGSAAFNLLVISAVCVAAIPSPEVRFIKEVPVFAVTASFSIIAYLWLLIIVVVISKDVVDIWEGLVTFLMFPLLVALAFAADKGMFSRAEKPQMTKAMSKGTRLFDDMTVEELQKAEMKIQKEYGMELSDEDVAKLLAKDIDKHKSKAAYCVGATRGLFGGKRIGDKADRQRPSMKAVVPISEEPVAVTGPPQLEPEEPGPEPACVVEFVAKNFAVSESIGTVKLRVKRKGDLTSEVKVQYESEDGIAKAGMDYHEARCFAHGDGRQLIVEERRAQGREVFKGPKEILTINGMDGLTFQIEVDERSTVPDVMKQISEKIDMKPGRMLMLTSGDGVLQHSEPLLPQVFEKQLTFVVKSIAAHQAAKSFWKAIADADSMGPWDLNAIDSIGSLTFTYKFNERLVDVRLPRSLQTLVFGENFNQSLEGVELPGSLQTLKFGERFDQSLAGVSLPSHLHTLIFDHDFDQSLEGVTLPNSLQTLVFGKKFNQSLEAVVLPNSLQSLTFGEKFDKDVAGMTFPSSLQTLIFGHDFQKSLEGTTLPSNLQSLKFDRRFDRSLVGVTLPSCLQTLVFGFHFNQGFEGVELPSSLQTLTFGYSFNQSLDAVQLPSSLQHLTFGKEFTQNLAKMTLPSKLQTLTLADHFNPNLDGVSLPSNVAVHIVFETFFDKSIDGCTFPVTVQSITFGEKFNRSLAGVEVPSGLKALIFGENFNQSLEDVTLPKSLKTLVFGSKFNQSLAAVSLPESLETLTFGFDFRQSLEGVTLPSSLLSLTFGSQFNQSLTEVALPSGLQTLTFGNNFDQSLEGVILPDSLQTLNFGNDFERPMAKVKLPTNLQTLAFGRNFNRDLTEVTWPSNLQTLTFGWKFNQSLVGVMLPSSLKTLTFGGGFQKGLEGVTMPISLEDLTLGHSPNLKLEDVSLPALRRYCGYGLTVKGELVFAPQEDLKEIEVPIIDDSTWEEDEEFYVHLTSIVTVKGLVSGLGRASKARIVIIDDDCPGVLSFEKDVIEVQESSFKDQVIQVLVNRKGGSSGSVSCKFQTEGASATQGADYVHTEGTLTFEEGVTSQEIAVTITSKGRYFGKEEFRLILSEAQNGLSFDPERDGGPDQSIATIVILPDEVAKSRLDRVASLLRINRDRAALGASNWKEQLWNAVLVNGGDEEEKPGAYDWVMHVISVFWKVAFALIPPPDYCGGWACFFCSLMMIGLVTALVADLAGLLGCVVGMGDAITAITLVALGTSLPDTFASKAAAQQDPYADASIGNITGSNSVNVFLGLGLPWSIGAIYWAAAGQTDAWREKYANEARIDFSSLEGGGGKFIVVGGDLGFSVGLFTGLAVVCIVTLIARRILYGGELGGPQIPKVLTAVFLVILWIVYVTVSAVNIIANKGPCD